MDSEWDGGWEEVAKIRKIRKINKKNKKTETLNDGNMK